MVASCLVAECLQCRTSADQKAICFVFYWSAEENLLLRTGKIIPPHSKKKLLPFSFSLHFP